ncbi:M15 family metallopeptidase [[Clostridium] symbiosum]|uniref:M15 family metallopeptidase n=1 Tax=Clostridium symbiosum TaxID=1512 RepID=UPI001D05CE61|nr:M15 family metallopeptidase [[Clostridium] symbiosum]MCB6609795.1 M15 family metallopeptidase [[Clostridium] symbiosum]MCB6931249.1 M15 family metallopeptidase [[Clostridium] symbiosum]
MMIYTFLLILVFTYIGARGQVRKLKAQDGAVLEKMAESPEEQLTEQPKDPDAGEQTGFFAWVKGLTDGKEEVEGKDELEGKGEAEGKDRAGGEGGAGEKGGPEREKQFSSKNENDSTKEKTSLTEGAAVKEASGNSGEAGPVIRQENMWALILTNARYPIPEDYTVELKVLPGTEQSVDARIYDTTLRMISDMKAEELRPIVCSAYRTLDRQEILFNRKVKSYVKKGYSMEAASREAQHVLSIPGSGEHCLGLAIDVCSQSYQRLEEGFEDTKEGKWLREHCAEYGFILRYDKGKEESTGINYEPWHFRYVGVDVAKYITEKGITLEEFYIEESLYG